MIASGTKLSTILKTYGNPIFDPIHNYNNTTMERGKKKSQIDTSALKLMYLSDLEKLMFLVSELVKFSKEVNQWKQDDYIRLTMELDKFYSIHSTRTSDLINTLERLENAKFEYAKLKAYAKELEETNEKQASVISELLQR